MKLWVLVAAMALAPFCFSQNEGFPDIPENHWVYETLRKLHGAEVVILPELVKFRTGAPLSRMRIAVIAFDACGASLLLVEDAEVRKGRASAPEWRNDKRIVASLQAVHQEAANLARMILHFAPELRKRHVATPSLHTEMKGLPPRIRRLLSASFSGALQPL